MVLPLASPIPTTAERIRSACARAGGVLLAIEGHDPVATPLHHLLSDGSFAVAVPADDAGLPGDFFVGSAGAQALLELTDYAPLPMREPVRSLVWVRGRLQRVPSAEINPTLDLIASECPHPALLQVDTPKCAAPAPGDERYTLLRLEIASVVVTDATGAEP